ncbi:MarR family transcriptional regulator [Nocardia sp. CDC153]|uniref:MarR family winged helix-turn-helix transcriptional regulator n=1 Tax=Nocardia sp. CDC153 TaxID=3112167 RepID=UPI002DBBDDA3|nr:MarR family transcriptional regulator [Nocardia sp. CDC153]MEC3957581.1 MarR family transcriptional regulator [Nocardia sp. CDC153]
MSASGRGTAAGEVVLAAAELRVVSSRLLRHLRSARAGIEVTPSQAVVLSRLGSEGALSVADLARAERVRPQSMRTTLAALEERGLVSRAAHPTDQRQVLMSLTAEGRRLLRAAHDAKEDWLAEAIRTKLSPAEQDSLIAAIPLLARLVED